MTEPIKTFQRKKKDSTWWVSEITCNSNGSYMSIVVNLNGTSYNSPDRKYRVYNDRIENIKENSKMVYTEDYAICMELYEEVRNYLTPDKEKKEPPKTSKEKSVMD